MIIIKYLRTRHETKNKVHIWVNIRNNRNYYSINSTFLDSERSEHNDVFFLCLYSQELF